MNQNDIIVFDMETGGLRSDYHEAIEIAAICYNARTLEPYPESQGGSFVSLMKPLFPNRLEDGALKVNNITREQLENAPDQKVVWNNFVDWVNKFNKTNNKWGTPIAAGKNIRTFDLLFVNELNKRHCPKKEKTLLFNERQQIDLEDFLLHWFENSSKLPNQKLDTVRELFKLNKNNAHRAMKDVEDTGLLIMKFLKLYRTLNKRVKFFE